MKTTIKIILASIAIALTSCQTTGGTSGNVKPYPLDTCIVTDNDLDSMGGAVSLIHEGQEVKFCCSPCIRKFNADPDRYLRQL